MEPNAQKESEFFKELLALCKKYGFSIDCSDPYECLVVGEYTEVFEKEFKRFYIDELYV